MSNVNVSVDRIAIRQMVEDGFRSQLLFHQSYIDAHPEQPPDFLKMRHMTLFIGGLNGLRRLPP